MGRDTNRFKSLINARFVMEDLCPCTFFLGMRFEWDLEKKTISLHQDKYAETMLEEYGMSDCRPCKTPMIPNSHLTPATPEDIAAFESTGENYRRVVGLLNYLVVCTQPDLALVASQLAQFLEHPGIERWAAFKRVLRYLRHTSHIGLVLGGSPVTLTCFSDSDYAGCPYTRCSITGYCAVCISWRARNNPTVATSSTEAEYRAAYKAAQEIIWLRQWLADLDYPQNSLTTLFCDKQGALALSKNPLYQSRLKHFDVTNHWIREKVEDCTILPQYISTSNMLADFLTKALHFPKFSFCMNGLRIQ